MSSGIIGCDDGRQLVAGRYIAKGRFAGRLVENVHSAAQNDAGNEPGERKRQDKPEQGQERGENAEATGTRKDPGARQAIAEKARRDRQDKLGKKTYDGKEGEEKKVVTPGDD